MLCSLLIALTMYVCAQNLYEAAKKAKIDPRTTEKESMCASLRTTADKTSAVIQDLLTSTAALNDKPLEKSLFDAKVKAACVKLRTHQSLITSFLAKLKNMSLDDVTPTSMAECKAQTNQRSVSKPRRRPGRP